MSISTHKSPRSLVSLRTLARSLTRTSLHTLLIVVGSLLIFSSHASAPEHDRDFVNALWVAESKALLKVETSTGKVLLDIPATEKPRAVAVDEHTGSVWIYGQDVLQQFSFSGVRLTRVTVPGRTSSSSNEEEEEEDGDGHLALTVDAAGSAVWLGRNKTLFRFNATGVLQFSITLPHPVRAQSLDPTRHVLWVATKKNLLAYTPQGVKIGEILSSQETEIQDLVVDTSLDSLWVATEKHLRRYSTSGTLQFERGFRKINRIASEGGGGLWVATEKELSFLDVSGLVRFTVTPFQGHSEGKIIDVVVDPTDRSAWVATKKALSHIDPEGQILHTLNFKEKSEREYRLHALAIYSDVLPPTLSVTAPVFGSYVNTPRPSLRLAYSDVGIGVDTNTLTATANQSALTLACDFEADAASCIPSSPFPEGLVSLHLTVKDFAGNLSDAAQISFSVDTIPPSITVTEPAEGFIIRQAVQLIKGQVSESADLRINNTVVPLQSGNMFAHSVSLSEGVNTISLAARDLAGNASTHTLHLTLDTAPPAVANAGLIRIEFQNTNAIVSGENGSVEAGATLTIKNVRTGITISVVANALGAFTAQIAGVAGDVFEIIVQDRAGNQSTPVEITSAAPGDTLPPDPTTVAPPIDPTVESTVFSTTAFLYTGARPIQTGVAPGTIEAKRAAVLRGRVLDRANTALAGVTITIKDHPEFGQTRSRADGMFDLAVNGGGTLTLNYTQAGYLPAQRQIHASWQDYAVLPDVILLPVDARVTSIDLTMATTQIARGNPVMDSDGARQATLLFAPGTTATMTLANGTQQALNTLNVRATEYTVGSHGPKAMPASLPPTSGYTYAVELSVDEALAAGAKTITFNQPVNVYVENFLNFPVGGRVPVGYYDRDKTAWMPSENGRVIEILTVNADIATLDTNGDGNPDSPAQLAALGITDAELQKLGTLYASETQLWRVPVKHFSPWDYNWPYGPPSDAKAPQILDPRVNPMEDEPDCQGGSIIECQNQALGESINITGTPFSLHYRSNRVPGHTASYGLTIPLSGATVSTSLKRIDYSIKTAGGEFRGSVPAAPNQIHFYAWNGRDVYGRILQGQQAATVNIDYVYDAIYQAPASFQQSFAAFSGVPLTRNRARGEVTLSQTSQVSIGGVDTRLGVWDARAQRTGGWTLNVLHAYLPAKQMLYLGDGRQRGARSLDIHSYVITTVAGTGVAGVSGEGGPATAAELAYPAGVAVGADGRAYVADTENHRIRRIELNGFLTTLAGTGERGFSGDGGLATAARLDTPTGVAIDSDGGVYIADKGNHRVRRIDPNGVITTVAGTDPAGYRGDEGLATAAGLDHPSGVTRAPDGTLYIADLGNLIIPEASNNVIRRVAPNNIITTLAGGVDGFRGDGGPVSAARFFGPNGIAAGPDGSIYIADTDNNRIRRAGPNGLITTVAGTGEYGSRGDGGPSAAAQIQYPLGVAVGPDGSVYIADTMNHRIRHIGPEGIITTIAGTGEFGFGGDGGPATAARLQYPDEVAVGPDGSLYIADTDNHRIRRVSPPYPGFGVDAVIPSEDGRGRLPVQL